MFSIFKKVRADEASSGHKSARDMNTTAIHIEKSKGEPLCGTSRSMYGDSDVTVQTVLDTAPNQHTGWRWCPECASLFTGKPASFFADYRQK